MSPKNDDELSSSDASGSSEEQSDDSSSASSSSSEVPMKDDDASDQQESDEQMKEDANDSSDSSSVSSDDDDDDSEDEVMNNAPVQQPAISKSWTALTTHSPCYTGGTVALSHENILSSTPSRDEEPSQPFILAQRGGDVSIIEAATGLLLRTVRKGAAFEGGFALDENENEDENDTEEEMLDAEAITAFALSPNNKEMIAVTRSHLVRKYNLAAPADDGAYDETEKKQSKKNTSEAAAEKPKSQSVTSIKDPAKIAFTFGKSGHKLPVTKVAFHPSGIFFATGSVDGLVKIWDTRNGYATHALHPTSDASGGGRGTYAVSCIQWRQTSASLILAIGREDGSIAIHDLLLNAQDTKTASMPVTVLRDHISAVTCVTWLSDGGGGGGSTTSSGLRKHGTGVFFSSGRDSVINTWLISEHEVADTSGPKSKKRRKSKDDDGTKRATTVKVTYQRIRTLPVYEQVESMLLLPRRFRQSLETGSRNQVLNKKDVVLATCGTKGIVRLWKATVGDKEAGIQSVVSDLSPLASQSESDAFGEDHGGYTSLHLTSGDNSILAIDAEQNMAFLQLDWANAEKSELKLASNRAIVGHNGEILDLSVIPGNKEQTVAVATNSSQVRIFGVADTIESDDNAHTALSPRGILDGHTAIVLSLDASPCGRYLATAGKDKTMRIWNVPTRTCVALATGHTEAVGSVALSNKIGCYDVGGKSAENGAGAFAVTASKDRTLKMWPLPGSAVLNSSEEEITLEARLSIRAHEKDINIVSVAPNDSLIATGSQDKTVKLWRSSDLALHGTLKGHKRGVWDCQFSQHDRVLATGSGDRTVKLWSIADCSCVRTFQGHMSSVLRVRFLGTGLQLLSSGSDGLIKLWTIRTNECESTIDAHDDKIWALDLSQAGTLFSGGADSKIAVWRDTTKEKDDEKREAEEKNILMEQTLSNHLRHKRYEQALELALELDKPHQVLKVLNDILEKDVASNRGIETLQKHAAKWQLDRLVQILKYCREWNTRARNSHIAMLVVKAVVTTIPAAKLATYQGVPEILAGIAPYAERHFDRLDGMVGNSYLMDYTLFSMGSIHGESKEKYDEWIAGRKYLPPKVVEGRIQIGGSLVVEGKKGKTNDGSDSDSDVITIGGSDSDSESE